MFLLLSVWDCIFSSGLCSIFQVLVTLKRTWVRVPTFLIWKPYTKNFKPVFWFRYKGHGHSPHRAGEMNLHKDFRTRESSGSHIVLPEHYNRSWGLNRGYLGPRMADSIPAFYRLTWLHAEAHCIKKAWESIFVRSGENHIQRLYILAEDSLFKILFAHLGKKYQLRWIDH